MLAESKIWLMALFMLISFVYKAWKKKKKTEEEAQELGESPPEAKSSSWGIDDLISQFEETYSTKKVTNDEWEFEEEPEISETIQPVEKPEKLNLSVVDENYSEETASHEAFKVEDSKHKVKDAYSQVTEIDDDTNKLTLRDMVISTTILNRPEY